MPHDPSSPPWVIPWNSEGLSNESVRRSVELASMAFDERFDAPGLRALRDVLRSRDTAPMRRRRAIVGLALIGLATALASLFHMEAVPRPAPFRRGAAAPTRASFPAQQYGLPDAMLSLGTYAVSLVFAGLGSEARARRTPWIPLMAAGKAAADVGVAARYLLFHNAGAERSWSGYAVVDAVVRLSTCVLTMPEAVEAVRYAVAAQPAHRRC